MMNAKHPRLLALILFALFLFSPVSFCQQGADQPVSPAPKKDFTPEQKAYQQKEKEYEAQRQSLQAQAKQVFAAEMAREKAGDCADASSTSGFDTCFDKQLTAADQSLKSYEYIIRKLQAGPPQMPGTPTDPTDESDGPVLSPEQLVAEFDQVELLWGRYRESACKAAFHQFEGGTGAPSFEMQCQLKLTRDHLRELDMIYGVDLQL
jgi:uncharacterized protein YecT (DUF1311 family)